MLIREPRPRNGHKHNRFKFENAWLVDPEFSSFVQAQWLSYGTQEIMPKLNCCASDLTFWSKTHFHHIRREVDKCRKQLEKVRTQEIYQQCCSWLSSGNRWRIGNGNNIPLWKENWLADALPLEPVNNNDLFYADILVSDIMELNPKKWNSDIVLSLFDDPTAARILATPLYPSVTDDRRIWRGESNGDYSVKSAYRICVQDLDTSHLRVVSNAANGDNDVKTVIFNILQQLSKKDAALLACILWSTWKQRNNKIWNNIIDAQSFVFSRVVSMLQDWRAVRGAATTSFR
ncbi:hypothetical protein QL285_068207 [Trifolium repens]|nr:hypothetical protein QL285_068207 [Trifolium repens]